jgi:DNA-binding LacI/PurR family transcriptional regulator
MDSLRRPPEDIRSVLILVRDADWQAKQDIRSVDVDGIIAYGAQSVLNELGVTVRIQAARMEQGEVPQYADEPGLAGLIMASGIVESGFVCELQAAGLPFVVAGSHVKPLCADCVMADYMAGTEQAVAHLYEGGRRYIGLVNGPPTTTSSAEKHRGFLLALSLRETCPSPSQVLVCDDFTSESGYAQTQQLLAQQPDLDAVVYASDALALGGLSALKESSRRVPDDVAVTGFYDYEFSRFTDPALTTVHVDLQAMGAIAARRLCMMLEQPDDQAWCVTVPTSLVVRAST